jgi:outer membrane immunogenic protein
MRRLGPGLVALALAATAVAAPARAADMPAPAPGYYPPVAYPPPALYDWTGIYFGGHVGGGLLEDHVSQSATAATTNLIGTTDVSAAGVIGGAQIGVNYEFARWVIGAEASWTDSDITGSGLASVTGGVPGTTQERATSNPLWFATATGHIGYAANTLLFYVKGGGAWMDVNYTQDQLAISANTFSQIIHDHRTGFTAGIGLEYGMTENLSAKLEYDFYDFGTKDYPFTFTPVAIASNLNTLTVGLNYRFNWAGGGPLVAKY